MIELVKLNKLCKMQSGGTPSRSNLEFYEGDFPWAKISDLEKSDDGYIYKTEEHITKEALNSINNRKFKPGTLLLAMYGSVGKTAITKIDLTTNQAILGINILDENILDIKYLKYWFSTIKERLLNRAVGAALPNISLGIVKELEIPLPLLSQQQKIANILDAADALRQNDKALIAKYDELTQALFLDMFGDPVSNPKGWEKVFLKSICTKITDGTHFSPVPQTEGFPYITAKHIKNYGLDFYSKPTYVSEEAHNEIYKRCTPKFGDVLYIKDGATTGIACINTFDEPFSMLSSLALIKPNKKIVNSYYLCHWLNNPKIKSKLLSEFMSGAAIQRYTLTKINSFELFLPSIDLQNQFAERVALIEEQKAIAQKSLEKSEELFNSLLQKAFKGELI
jgi:type I restriction enzyme, S subunit